jgi:hypothetical protein
MTEEETERKRVLDIVEQELAPKEFLFGISECKKRIIERINEEKVKRDNSN